MICQLNRYIEELHKKFKDNLPKYLKTLLDKIDLPSVYLIIMKILITKGNPTLMPKGATDKQLSNQSRKKVQPTYTPTRGEKQDFTHGIIHRVL